jgi:hypothetical protein
LTLVGDPIGLPRPVSSLDRLAGLLAVAGAVGVGLLAGLFTLHRLYDFDVLWHVKTGQWIWEHRQIPHTDPFGGKTAGIPWLDVSWGAQVLAAGLVRFGGLLGLQLLVVAGVIALLALLLRRGPLSPMVLAGALAFVLTAGQRFLIRPDILSFPLTMATLLLIDRLPQSPRLASFLLAALAAFWTNLHGSFILVLFLLLAAALGSLATGDRLHALKAHTLPILMCAGAILLNPYGYRIYRLFEPYVRSIFSPFGLFPAGEELGVAEWTPTWRVFLLDPIFPTLAFLSLIALLALSFMRLGRAASPRRIACACALLVLSMAAVRNILPFGAGALWMIVRNERERRKSSHPTRSLGLGLPWPRIGILAVVGALAWGYCFSVLSDRYYVERQLPIVTGVGPSLDLVPEGAVQWLARNQPAGRIFNNFNSGSYLLYRLWPGVENYIDERFPVTQPYREIRQALDDPAAFDALLERDGIGAIVLIHPSPESLSLLPRLAGDSRWRLAFRDENSTIHVRSDAPATPRVTPIPLPPAIEPAAATINATLMRCKRANLPAADLTDAFVAGILGERDRQREAYRRVLARSPDNPQALAYFAENP